MQRVLLLDDEPHVIAALKRVLRSGFGAGLRVETTTDPEEALALLRDAPFDLVISDFRMPLMSGTEFLQLVRSLQPEAVRIILSASTDGQTLMQAVNDAEVFRYLAKPWVEADLLGQVRQALERAAQIRHERELADATRVQFGAVSAADLERRRLEALEPGITHVEWGPDGEVLMPIAGKRNSGP
ncbi:MAG TPA: response regulator [Burkholderiaceae bacterium]|nr:response regulator [Burkholderiaceae bacterium]